MISDPGQSYDETPYESSANASAHPDRLCTLGGLFGMSPSNIEHSRVLELGCAEGGNLIPMALALPGSEFIGLDISGRQIEAGRKVVRALGLDNLSLQTADLSEVDESWGHFDYILCHGVYSWVPEEIRDAILAICKQNLSPNGIAVVSYNTYPGWHLRKLSQGLMRYHTRGIGDPQKRIAQSRAVLDWMAETLPENFDHRRHLANERDLLDRSPDTYLLHEHLEPDNEPLYFHQFARRVADCGLQYLGDSNPATMSTANLPSELAQAIEHLGTDIISAEQYRDFIVNQSFRSSLLCHSDVPLNHSVRVEAVYELTLRSSAKASDRPRLEPGVGVSFTTHSGDRIASNTPLTKAAFTLLGESYPAAVRFEDLHRQSLQRLRDQRVRLSSTDDGLGRRELAVDLLHAVFGGVVEARSWSPDVEVDPGPRPRASRLAALAVSLGGSTATNQFHTAIALEPAMRELIPLLDGTRDRDALQAQLARRMADPDAPLDVANSPGTSPAAVCRDALSKLAGSALLISQDGRPVGKQDPGRASRDESRLAVECGVIGCDRAFPSVAELRAHAQRDHHEPAPSVHRASPATQYVQDLIWPPGVERTVANGLRRLAELEWIDDGDEQKLQQLLANRTLGHHKVPLNIIAPHSAHLSKFHDGHSEVLLTIGDAPSPPHVDFYSPDGAPPASFTPISGNQLLLSGTKEWTHIPSAFLTRGFEWMRDQMYQGTDVARSWPRARTHAGDETTAAGGEIHAVTQISEITLSLGSAFFELDSTTIPQDRSWLKEE